MKQPVASVTIRLADAAPAFVEKAIDLLFAVEEEHVLVSDEIKERAEELREIIRGGRW